MPETTEPATVSELGVIGAQNARADAPHRAKQAEEYEQAEAEKPKPEHPIAQPEMDAQIRTRAIELAQQSFGFGIIQADAVLATARVYETFIKGEPSV